MGEILSEKERIEGVFEALAMQYVDKRYPMDRFDFNSMLVEEIIKADPSEYLNEFKKHLDTSMLSDDAKAYVLNEYGNFFFQDVDLISSYQPRIIKGYKLGNKKVKKPRPVNELDIPNLIALTLYEDVKPELRSQILNTEILPTISDHLNNYSYTVHFDIIEDKFKSLSEGTPVHTRGPKLRSAEDYEGLTKDKKLYLMHADHILKDKLLDRDGGLFQENVGVPETALYEHLQVMGFLYGKAGQLDFARFCQQFKEAEVIEYKIENIDGKVGAVHTNLNIARITNHKFHSKRSV